ncbi:MAG: hypothetical protein H7293_01940 [Candidatus Saccharibacteria bacterium]|nr:hypothetical protein [Rhodoferax sp.]
MSISSLTDTKTAASSLTNTATQTSSAAAQAAASANPAIRAMGKAAERLQTQLDTTSAQLSSFGKLKSSVSEAQLAAKALGGFTASSSSSDVRTALSRFLVGLNTAVATAGATAALPGSALSESTSATRVSRDLTRSVTSDTATLDAIKKLGFKLQTDGSFAWDGAKFDAAYKADPSAVRATLAKLGQAVNTVATQELATNAKVSGSLASLNLRATTLKAQQTSMLAVVEKLNSANISGGSTGYINYGVSAYRW